MSQLLLLLPLVAIAYGELNCDADPIALPIRDVQVLSDVEDSYMKGIAAKVGTPSQDIVLLPWAYVTTINNISPIPHRLANE